MTAASARSRGEKLCGYASVLLPFGLYLWTAAPAPTWLDSAEFLAVGVNFGSAHPPGHPLFINLFKLISLLPLGSIAFRGALLSALCAALCCALLFRVNLRLIRELDQGAPRWMAPLFSLLGALLLGTTGALWSQATRPEVYSLQLLVVLGGLAALVRFGLEPRGQRSGALLAAASFAFGLSLTNHHFLSLLLVPGVIVLLTEDALGQWHRTLRLIGAGSLPAIGAGLLAYAHLPLRTGNTPGAVSLGAAPDVQTFFWVVSARAFQRSITDPPTIPFDERLLEAAFLLATQLGPVTVVIALGGLYFLVRQRWAVGSLLVLGLITTWMARSWMGFNARNPDVMGYLLVAVSVLVIGVARVGPLLATIVPARLTVRVGGATVAALTMAGLTVDQVASGWSENDRTADRGAEVVVDHQLQHMPPRSVVITELFGSGFNLWAAQTVEGARPDVAHFHFPFIGFPGYVQQVHAENPDLQGVLRAALARGVLDETELSALAQRRAVYLEPQLDLSEEIQPFVLPRGLLWEAAAEPLGQTDLRLATPAHFARWDELLARLGEQSQEEQTRDVLLWRIYVDALLLAQRGHREASAQAIDRGLQIAPGIPELERLRDALALGRGELDITPFLPGSAADSALDDVEEGPTRPPVLDF